MIRKISCIYLILILFLLLPSCWVSAQTEKAEKSLKWHYFFARVQLYIKKSIDIVDQAGKLIEPYVSKFRQIESRIEFNNNEKINELSIEAINEISFLQDQLNKLSPPEDFSLYHQRANQVFEVLISFVESSMKEKRPQEYAEMYLPLLIDMSEEIRNNYIEYKVPQEYISSQEQRIDELTLSLLKYKDFKRKISK